MRFLIQFIWFRRGEPEAIRTLPIEAADADAALARVTSRVGTGSWPMNTEAFRVMDDGGRTVLQCMAPTSAADQIASTPNAPQDAADRHEPLSAGQPVPDKEIKPIGFLPTGIPHLEIGQAIAYAEDGQSGAWEGGYEIVKASEPTADEAQYTIRSADETQDRIVKEHELREDLGSRTRGQ